MGWDQRTELTEAEKADMEMDAILEKANPTEGATLTLALSLFKVMKKLKAGEKIEDSVLHEIVKASLLMLLYAGECGNFDLLQSTLKKENTIEQFLNTLPLLRMAAGHKAAKWGDDLIKLLTLIGVD